MQLRTTPAYTGISGTSISLPATHAQDGDVLVAVVVAQNPNAVIAPSQTGWAASDRGSNAHVITAFARVLTDDPPASYTFTVVDSQIMQGVILAIDPEGATVEEVVMSLSGALNAATVTTGAVTAVGDPSLLLALFSNDDGRSVSSAPSGMTPQSVPGTATLLAAYSQINPPETAGNPITRSLTWSSADQTYGISVLIEFSSAAGTDANVAETVHGHVVERPTATQAITLTIPSVSHGHVVDAPDTATGGAASVSGAVHGHVAETPTITQAIEVGVTGVRHDHVVDAPLAVDMGQPRWGALGDSNTDEYRGSDNRAGGTPYASTTLNWLEQLAAANGGATPANHSRNLNFGAWGTHGDIRRTGYANNWSRSGWTMGGVVDDQLDQVAAQIIAGDVTHVAIQGTVNELLGSGDYVEDAYLSNDGGVTGGVTGQPIANHIAEYVGHFNTCIDDLIAAGAEGIVCILPPDYMQYPDTIAAAPDATRRGYVTAMMQAIWDAIIAHAQSVNTAEARTAVVWHRWDEDFAPIWATLDGELCTVAGVQINVFDSAVNGSPYYRSVDGHTGTVFEAVIANSFMAAANQLPGISIEPFSNQEIRENAGIFGIYDADIGDVVHAHVAARPAATSGHAAAVPDVAHAHVAARPETSSGHNASVPGVTHAHVAARPETMSGVDAGVPDIAHEHVAAQPSATSGHIAFVPGVAHAQVVGLPEIAQAYTLAVLRAVHQHYADRPDVSTAVVVDVVRAVHAHVAELPSSQASSPLTVLKAIHAHVAERVAALSHAIVVVPGIYHDHLADEIGVVIPPSDDAVYAVIDGEVQFRTGVDREIRFRTTIEGMVTV